jgi:hypothetical protein
VNSPIVICVGFDFHLFVHLLMEVLVCVIQILKPADKKKFLQGTGGQTGRPVTPMRGAAAKNAGKM